MGTLSTDSFSGAGVLIIAAIATMLAQSDISAAQPLPVGATRAVQSVATAPVSQPRCCTREPEDTGSGAKARSFECAPQSV